MTLRYDDVALMVEHLTLPEDVMSRLRRAAVELDLSDEQVATLNDVCLAHLQERGFDQTGSATDLGRRLEHIIDALNED